MGEASKAEELAAKGFELFFRIAYYWYSVLSAVGLIAWYFDLNKVFYCILAVLIVSCVILSLFGAGLSFLLIICCIVMSVIFYCFIDNSIQGICAGIMAGFIVRHFIRGFIWSLLYKFLRWCEK